MGTYGHSHRHTSNTVLTEGPTEVLELLDLLETPIIGGILAKISWSLGPLGQITGDGLVGAYRNIDGCRNLYLAPVLTERV
jgi:hypothetical protein